MMLPTTNNSKRSTPVLMALVLVAIFISCHDTLVEKTAGVQIDEGDLDEIPLSIKVNELSVNTATRAEEQSETPEEATADDNYVDDLWVFQYDESGNLLIVPRYYKVKEQEELANFPVYLKSNVSSNIYVVTNTQNETWASSYTDFNTIDKLKEQTLVNPRPVVLGSDNEGNYIPMEGMTEEPVTPSATVSEPIEVPVTRMYAKVKVRICYAELLPNYYNDIEVSYVYVENIPEYCKVTSISSDEDDEKKGVAFPEGTGFISKAINGEETEVNDDGYPYVIYVPENLRGETDNGEDAPDEKATNKVPDNALSITVQINFKNKDDDAVQTGIYTVYPGGNDYNNYNIRRNDVYRVTLNVGYPLEETPVPSANCICGFAGETLSFYPYYRVETGGNDNGYYDFKTYLDPTDGSKTINGLKIIWQTEGCIGDNSDGSKVFLRQDTSQEEDVLQYKIYVKTTAAGNAVIAAYSDAECTSEILWSWHIWVRDKEEGDPTNIANAITYYTYDWDDTGIHTDRTRILGYPVMSCNIGALADDHTTTSWSDYSRTYGTLYQWGRKDPFPPCKSNGRISNIYNYDETTANVVVYDNGNNKIDMTNNDGLAGDGDGFKVFNTIRTINLTTQTQAYGIEYSIQNPTMFISAAGKLSYSSSSFDNPNNYDNLGDWLPAHDDNLWGGIDDYTKSYTVYSIDGGDAFTASLKNNYGPEKTIFDPCPYGWRTAPGDIWLSFTIDGRNQSFNASNINCSETSTTEIDNNRGYHMYLQDWKRGQQSFFPTQGSRMPSGQPILGGVCGNYHNATADDLVDVKFNGTVYPQACKRVDILHLHAINTTSSKVNIYETGMTYYSRAVAGPVRCVRETK